MTGLIYKATNTKTGKVYVGQTTLTLTQRKNGHLSDARCNKTSMYFHRSIKKYGEKVFTWDILEDGIPINELSFKEKYYINMEDSFNSGYNLSIGGTTNHGWKASKETRANMSIAQKGRIFSEEAKKKMSEAQKGVKSHTFKPWYIIPPSKSMVCYFGLTIKDYAKVNNIPYTTLKNVFKKTPIQGRFKGYRFGYIKDLKWTKAP
jgi:group I intron endonuclease